MLFDLDITEAGGARGVYILYRNSTSDEFRVPLIGSEWILCRVVIF